jgi:hypothetical protein
VTQGVYLYFAREILCLFGQSGITDPDLGLFAGSEFEFSGQHVEPDPDFDLFKQII